MFVAKDKAPYADELEQPVYLDPLARVENAKEKLVFSNKGIQSNQAYTGENARNTAKALASLNKSSKGVGVDVELLSAINLKMKLLLKETSLLVKLNTVPRLLVHKLHSLVLGQPKKLFSKL